MSEDQNSESKKRNIVFVFAAVGILLFFIAGLVIGVVSGLFYAWVYNPVECVDCVPDQLTEPYKSKYIGLVVDSYSIDRNMNSVTAWLGTMEDAEVLQILSEHYDCAQKQNDHDRANLIKEIMLIYNRPNSPD